MKRYTIEIGGRGAECYVFPLTDEQLTNLKIGGIVEEKMDMDNVYQILGVESVLDTDFTYVGPYDDSDMYYIKVLDENDEVIGGFKQKFFSLGGAFSVLDVNDQPVVGARVQVLR